VNEISINDEEILYSVMNKQEKELIKKATQFELYSKQLNECNDVECLKKIYKSINNKLITQLHLNDLIKIKDQIKNNLTTK
jgi:hypothetical protein